jgi:hypothetical protein
MKKAKEIKIRKAWGFNPASRPHSTDKGKKGYSRKDNKRIERSSY